jgi:predicted AAA+ superfamily ATPase
VFYWREQNREVDFIIRAGRTVVAFEVKSGRSPDAFPGLAEFSKAFNPTRTLLIGGDGIALDEFLAQPIEHWLA